MFHTQHFISMYGLSTSNIALCFSQAIDEVLEEKGCIRNTVLVVHVSDKQSHYLCLIPEWSGRG